MNKITIWNYRKKEEYHLVEYGSIPRRHSSCQADVCLFVWTRGWRSWWQRNSEKPVQREIRWFLATKPIIRLSSVKQFATSAWWKRGVLRKADGRLIETELSVRKVTLVLISYGNTVRALSGKLSQQACLVMRCWASAWRLKARSDQATRRDATH